MAERLPRSFPGFFPYKDRPGHRVGLPGDTYAVHGVSFQNYPCSCSKSIVEEIFEGDSL